MQFTWRKILLLTCLLIVISVFAILAWSWERFTETPLTQKPIVFIVPPGSSIKSVSIKLHSLGVLKHPNYFSFLAFIRGDSKHIKAGEYQIDAGSTPKQLLFKLVKGKVVLHPFTIVEGWTLNQVLTSAQNNQFLHHTLNQNNIENFSQRIGCPNNNLEGYLYPDTYLFARNVNDSVIIGKAYALMKKKLVRAWQTRDKNLPYKTPYEALIVASLIEKETARTNERTKISGVILRRIQKNMLLQVDASIIYGLGKNYQGKITKEDLKVNTPFNTYMRRGLPPSPIAMPSYASIVAALHPQAGTSLYYVARGDGSHEFTNSLEEHHKAIQKYRMNYIGNLKVASYSQHDAFEKVMQNISWYATTKTPEKKTTTSKQPPAKNKSKNNKVSKKSKKAISNQKKTSSTKANKKSKTSVSKKGQTHAKHKQ